MVAWFAFMVVSLLVAEPAFQIGKQKPVDLGDLVKANEAEFFKIETSRFELVERLATEAYLEAFWQEEAKRSKKSVDQARADYVSKRAKVSDKEVKEALEKYGNHPKLQELKTDAEKKASIRSALEGRAQESVITKIVDDAKKGGELKILYPRPKEPEYNITVTDTDHVRYGPNPEDSNPLGCKDDCPVTVVEYSEYECPWCERVVGTSNRLLKEYKGKVRWVVRDFPLSFHQQARPAAVAAHCAGQQGKYWFMYKGLFENQSRLGEKTYQDLAKGIPGINYEKWEKCSKEPTAVLAMIDRNMQSGVALGIGGTPGFFINKRRFDGGLPYERFKQVFDEELSKKK